MGVLKPIKLLKGVVCRHDQIFIPTFATPMGVGKEPVHQVSDEHTVARTMGAKMQVIYRCAVANDWNASVIKRERNAWQD